MGLYLPSALSRSIRASLELMAAALFARRLVIISLLRSLLNSTAFVTAGDCDTELMRCLRPIVAADATRPMGRSRSGELKRKDAVSVEVPLASGVDNAASSESPPFFRFACRGVAKLPSTSMPPLFFRGVGKLRPGLSSGGRGVAAALDCTANVGLRMEMPTFPALTIFLLIPATGAAADRAVD